MLFQFQTESRDCSWSDCQLGEIERAFEIKFTIIIVIVVIVVDFDAVAVDVRYGFGTDHCFQWVDL